MKPRKKDFRAASSQALGDYIDTHPEATQKEIAAFFKCDQSTVSQMLKQYNIEYRKKKGGKIPKLSPSQLQQYISAHPAATQKEIAEFFGCNCSIVGRAIKRYDLGYNPKHGGNTPKLSPQLLKEYIQAHPDATLHTIAKHFGFHFSTVSIAISKNNIEYRSKRTGRHTPKGA